MNFARKALPVLFIASALLLPQVSFAAATFFGPIIPKVCECKDSAPDYGCVLQTVQNTMNFGVSISVILVTLAIAYAGFLWILSPVNPQNRETARTALMNAFIGLVIVLAAWLIVDFVMKKLYSESSFGPWNEILHADSGTECIVPKTPMGSILPSSSGSGLGTAPNPSSPTGSLVAITAFKCKEASSCKVPSSVNDQLNQMKTKLGGAASQYQITETGVSTTVHHASGANNLDMSCFGTCSGAQVKAAINAWPGSVKYETNSQADYNAKKAAGVPTSNMLLLTGTFVNGECSTGTGHCVTAPHMSLNQ